MRRPSTLIASFAGSALVPSSRTVWPFTITRPSRIICSDARRDATPAAERIFCSLIKTSRPQDPRPKTQDSVFHERAPETGEAPDFRGCCGAIHLGVCDQTTQQAVDARFSFQMFR